MLRSRIPIIACHCRFARWPEFKNELQPASQCVVFDGCPEDDISFKMEPLTESWCWSVASLYVLYLASFIVIDRWSQTLNFV